MDKTYFISGIWTDSEGNPTDYCIHQYSDLGVSRMKKISKERLIGLLTRFGIYAYVFIWDYNKGRFVQGQQVDLVQGISINTVPPIDDHKGLKHLIRLNWFE